MIDLTKNNNTPYIIGRGVELRTHHLCDLQKFLNAFKINPTYKNSRGSISLVVC